MLRGELSSRPQPICAVDWRILVEPRYPEGWFRKMIPQLLLQAGFESRMRALLPMKKGARRWLERNFETRFCAIVVGSEEILPSIEMVLADHVAEFEFFDDPGELRTWLRQTPEVYRLYTNDPALLGIDDTTRPHSGWNEKA